MRSIKVRDCMTAQVITISPDIAVVKAIGILLQNDITAAPIVDSDGNIVGILSESDCLQGTLVESYFSQGGGLVKDYMTSEVKTVHPDDDIISVYQHFMAHRAFRIPVLDGGEIVGILSPKDLMVAVLEFFERPAANQLHMGHHS